MTLLHFAKTGETAPRAYVAAALDDQAARDVAD
jgi:hypothetical protein